MKKSTITYGLAAILPLVVAGIALTQPSDSNWREQGGLVWHIGGDLDIESGGEIEVESGGTLDIQSGSTVTNAGTTTASGATTFDGTVTANSTLTAAGIVSLTGSTTVVEIPCTVGATAATVTVARPDDSYMVFLEPTNNVTPNGIASKTASSFVFNYICATADVTPRAVIIDY